MQLIQFLFAVADRTYLAILSCPMPGTIPRSKMVVSVVYVCMYVCMYVHTQYSDSVNFQVLAITQPLLLYSLLIYLCLLV